MSKYHIKPGDLVPVFSEETNKWIGPIQVVKTERKIIHVRYGVKTKTFNASQVMPILITNPAEDEYLDAIYKHIDTVQEGEVQQTYLTEILKKEDPRVNSDNAKAAGRKDPDGLYNQGVFLKTETKRHSKRRHYPTVKVCVRHKEREDAGGIIQGEIHRRLAL